MSSLYCNYLKLVEGFKSIFLYYKSSIFSLLKYVGIEQKSLKVINRTEKKPSLSP